MCKATRRPYIEFPPLESSCVERAHTQQAPQEIVEALQQLLAGVLPELDASAYYVPAEALALLEEADFQALSETYAREPVLCPCLRLGSCR